MVVGTFTAEVASSFEYLRHAIGEMEDQSLRSTMTAIVDGLVLNLENQMLLVFANCAVKEHEREQLLLKGQQDVGLLQYYQESITKMEQHGLVDDAHHTMHRDRSGPHDTDDHGNGRGSRAQGAPDDSTLRTVAPDHEVTRTLMAFFYCTMQALAHNAHAEKAVLHLAQKSTGSLRAVCTIPDYTIAQRGLTTPSHQGVIGNCFSTGLAIRVDSIDMEKRKSMYVHSPEVHSALVLPILDPIRNVPIGVVELLNKSQGSPWNAMDEAHAFHTALLLQYYLHTFGQMLDFHNATPFNPTLMNVVQPYIPGHVAGDLARLPGGNSGAFIKQQLVARIGGNVSFPVRQKHSGLYGVQELANVRELSEYLDIMDFNMRSHIAELVASKQREVEIKDSMQKLSIRCKVQEENAQHLQDQLNEAKRVILAQKISAGENTSRFGDNSNMNTFRPGMTTRQSLTQRSLQKVPLTATSNQSHSKLGASSHSPSEGLPPVREPLRPSALHDFLANAEAELKNLQMKALGNSDAQQRYRILKLTPQAKSPQRKRASPTPTT